MRVCPTCRAEFPEGANYCPNDGRELEDQDTSAAEEDRFLGELFDNRYRIESRLGQGGMGMVYAARHVMIDKPVAIKVLRHEYCRDKGLVQRFIREARAASRIGHANIVDVTDFGTLPDGHIFFVMEYLLGWTLGQLMRKARGMPLSRVADLALQICRGLGAAHAKGIIHRDLKPENVFVVNPRTNDRESVIDIETGQRRDFVKLLDFGIAKFNYGQKTRLTRLGSVFGTPQYMCPEQAGGEDADHRGDVYSLGCILYEMVTGQVPFTSDTFMGTLTKHMFEQPLPLRQLRPDLGISAQLEQVVLRMLAKDPKERFQSMAEVAVELQVFAPDADPMGGTPRQRAGDDRDGGHTRRPSGTYPPGVTQLDLRSGGRGAKEAPSPQLDLEVVTNQPESAPSTAAPVALVRRKIQPTDTVDPLKPPRARNRGRGRAFTVAALTLAGVGVLALLVVAWRASRGGSGAAQQPRSAALGPVVKSPPPDHGAVRPDAGPLLVTLHITSEPTGADVWRGARYIGLTPTKEVIKEGETLNYLFSKKGFQDLARTVVASAVLPKVEVELVRAGRRRKGRHGVSARDLMNPFLAGQRKKRK